MTHPMPSDRDTAPAAVDRLRALLKSAEATIALLMERFVAAEAERDALRDRVRVVEEALLMCAAHCQGGHGDAGARAAKVLAVPFPIRMDQLERRADLGGFDKRVLWPWLYRRAALSQNRTEDGTDEK